MATLTVQPSGKDNQLRRYAPTYNWGATNYIYIYDGADYLTRSIVYFDVSSLPEGVTIISAKLQLYYFENGGLDPSGKKINVYKLTRDNWTEGDKNGAAGVSNWNKYDADNNWTTSGGDYVTSNPSGASQTMPSSYGWVEWDIKAIVEDAIANVNGHVNLLLRADTEETIGFASQFYGKDESTETTKRPKLVIEYTSGISGVKVNVGGTLKAVSKAQVKVGSSWKNVSKAQLNKGGVWKTIF